MNMKNTVAVMTAAVALSVVSGLAAQTPKPAPHQMDQMKTTGDMSAKCKAMMAEHEKMSTDTKAADEKLNGLVTTMNAASASAKPAAIAVVVTELVNQRHAMHASAMKMQQGMMTHMMEHMAEGRDSITMCPMMKHK